MTSISEADKKRIVEFEEQNKDLRAKCADQEAQLKRLSCAIQTIEGKLQLQIRQHRQTPRSGLPHVEGTALAQRELRLEAEIRDQARANEALRREVQLLKHSPPQPAKGTPLSKRQAQSHIADRSKATKASTLGSGGRSDAELQRLVASLQHDLEAARQRLKLQESGHSGRLKRRASEGLESMRAEIQELSALAKALEHSYDSKASAIKVVKDNDLKLVDQTEQLMAQLSDIKANVASLHRHKQVPHPFSSSRLHTPEVLYACVLCAFRVLVSASPLTPIPSVSISPHARLGTACVPKPIEALGCGSGGAGGCCHAPTRRDALNGL